MSSFPVSNIGSNNISFDEHGYSVSYPALTDPHYQENWDVKIDLNAEEMSQYKEKVISIIQNRQAKQADIVHFIDSAPSFSHLLGCLFIVKDLLLHNQIPANTELFFATLFDRLPHRLTFRLNQQTSVFRHIMHEVRNYVKVFYQTFEGCRLLYNILSPNNNLLSCYITIFPSDDKNSPCYVNPIAFWFLKNLSICDWFPHFDPFVAASESLHIDLPKEKLEQFITLTNCGFLAIPTTNRLNPNNNFTLTWQNLKASTFEISNPLFQKAHQRHCHDLLSSHVDLMALLIKSVAKSCPFLAPLMFIETVKELPNAVQLQTPQLPYLVDLSTTLFSSIIERPELMKELIARIEADPSASIVHFILHAVDSQPRACTLLLETSINMVVKPSISVLDNRQNVNDKMKDSPKTIGEIFKILNANPKKAVAFLPYACTLAKKGGIKLCYPYAATLLASVALFARDPLNENQIKLCANILLDKNIKFPNKIPNTNISIHNVHRLQLGIEMLQIIKSQGIPNPMPTLYWDIILTTAMEKIGLYIKNKPRKGSQEKQFYDYLKTFLFVMFTQDMSSSKEHSNYINTINHFRSAPILLTILSELIKDPDLINEIKTRHPFGAHILIQHLSLCPMNSLGEDEQKNAYRVWKIVLSHPSFSRNILFPCHRIWGKKIFSFMARYPEKANFDRDRLFHFLINYVLNYAQEAPLDHIGKIIQKTPLPITRELFVPLARLFPNKIEELIGRKVEGKEQDWLVVSQYQPSEVDFKEVRSFIVAPPAPSKGAYTEIEISCFCTLFDQLNFEDRTRKDFIDPKKLIAKGKQVDVKTFKGYVNDLVNNVTKYVAIAAAPADPQVRKAFYDELHNYLKLIAFLLLQDEPFENHACLIELGQIGAECASPYNDIPALYHALVQTRTTLLVPYWWVIPRGSIQEQRIRTIESLSSLLPKQVGQAVRNKLKTLPSESLVQAFTELQNSISFAFLIPWVLDIAHLVYYKPEEFERFQNFIGAEITKVLSGEASACGSKLRTIAVNLQKVDFAPTKQIFLKLMGMPAQTSMETALDALVEEVEKLSSLRKPLNLRDKVMLMFHIARWKFFKEALAKKPTIFSQDIHNEKYIKSHLEEPLGIYESVKMQITYQDNFAKMGCDDFVYFLMHQFRLTWNSAYMVEIFQESFGKPGGIEFGECRDWFKAYPDIKEEWEPDGEWGYKLTAKSAADLLKSMGLLKKEEKQ